MNNIHTHTLVLFLVIVGLSGCGKQGAAKPAKSAQTAARPVALRQFEARIDGVECALCAKDVVTIFKNIEGVQMADYIHQGADYEEGYVRFFYDVNKKNMHLTELDQKIRDEGFELTSITGSFHVEPFSQEGKQFIVFNEGLAIPLLMGHDFNAIKSLGQHYTEIRFAQGELVRQQDQEGFAFIMQHA